MTNTAQKTKGTADNVDKHVGKQLRSRRTLLGLSQEKLADHIGVTFQQIQKYERGTNRVSSSRLYSFSKILDVPIDYFYEGIEGESNPSDIPANVMHSSETLNLIRRYYNLNGNKTRKLLVTIIKGLEQKPQAVEPTS